MQPHDGTRYRTVEMDSSLADRFRVDMAVVCRGRLNIVYAMLQVDEMADGVISIYLKQVLLKITYNRLVIAAVALLAIPMSCSTD
jgi:hypothetical protein